MEVRGSDSEPSDKATQKKCCANFSRAGTWVGPSVFPRAPFREKPLAKVPLLEGAQETLSDAKTATARSCPKA